MAGQPGAHGTAGARADVPPSQNRLRRALMMGDVSALKKLLRQDMDAVACLSVWQKMYEFFVAAIWGSPPPPRLDYVYEDDAGATAVHYLAAGKLLSTSSYTDVEELYVWTLYRVAWGEGKDSSPARAAALQWLWKVAAAGAEESSCINLGLVNWRLENALHCCLMNGGSPHVLATLLAILWDPAPAEARDQPAAASLLKLLSGADTRGLTALQSALTTNQWSAAGALISAGGLKAAPDQREAAGRILELKLQTPDTTSVSALPSYTSLAVPKITNMVAGALQRYLPYGLGNDLASWLGASTPPTAAAAATASGPSSAQANRSVGLVAGSPTGGWDAKSLGGKDGHEGLPPSSSVAFRQEIQGILEGAVEAAKVRGRSGSKAGASRRGKQLQDGIVVGMDPSAVANSVKDSVQHLSHVLLIDEATAASILAVHSYDVDAAVSTCRQHFASNHLPQYLNTFTSHSSAIVLPSSTCSSNCQPAPSVSARPPCPDDHHQDPATTTALVMAPACAASHAPYPGPPALAFTTNTARASYGDTTKPCASNRDTEITPGSSRGTTIPTDYNLVTTQPIGANQGTDKQSRSNGGSSISTDSNPGSIKPSASNPDTIKPGGTNPGTIKPSGSNPGTTKPGGTCRDTNKASGSSADATKSSCYNKDPTKACGSNRGTDKRNSSKGGTDQPSGSAADTDKHTGPHADATITSGSAADTDKHAGPYADATITSGSKGGTDQPSGSTADTDENTGSHADATKTRGYNGGTAQPSGSKGGTDTPSSSKGGADQPSNLNADTDEHSGLNSGRVPSGLNSGLISGRVPPSGPCLVCFEEGGDAVRSVSLPCAHATCDDCWRGILNARLDEGDPHRCRCPHPECGVALPVTAAELLLEPAEYQRLLHMLGNHYVELHPRTAWCPRPGCGHSILLQPQPSDLEKLQPALATSRGINVTCPSCHWAFCFHCGGHQHEPASCQQIDAWNHLREKIAELEEVASEKWVGTHTKECPKCHVRVQRDGGCNHMTCKRCSYQWCWVCTANWEDHSGDFYNCNRYDPTAETGAETGADGEEAPGPSANPTTGASGGIVSSIMQLIKSSAARHKLEYYTNRFMAHECNERQISASLSHMQGLCALPKLRLLKGTERSSQLGAELSLALCLTLPNPFENLQDDDFWSEWRSTIVEAKMVLQCSYVLGYNMTDAYSRRYLEVLQGKLQSSVESLISPPERLPHASKLLPKVDGIQEVAAPSATLYRAVVGVLSSTAGMVDTMVANAQGAAAIAGGAGASSARGGAAGVQAGSDAELSEEQKLVLILRQGKLSGVQIQLQLLYVWLLLRNHRGTLKAIMEEARRMKEAIVRAARAGLFTDPMTSPPIDTK